MTGLTKDAGWEIGVSKTVPYPAEQVWQLLTSRRGIRLWLGETELGTNRGDRYETADGTVGELRGYRPNDRLRLTWRPPGWDHDSTVQLTVTAQGDGRSVLRFHQERLADETERSRQRDHWRAVMTQILDALD
jgi:uncharacterized protein YndB with AHSA1/START domain